MAGSSISDPASPERYPLAARLHAHNQQLCSAKAGEPIDNAKAIQLMRITSSSVFKVHKASRTRDYTHTHEARYGGDPCVFVAPFLGLNLVV